MKQIALYLGLFLFATTLLVGCGKKFDENLHKDMQAAYTAMEAASKSAGEIHTKMTADYKAALGTMTLAPETAQKHANMMQKHQAQMAGYGELLKRNMESIDKYKKGEIKTEDAMAAQTALKADQEKIGSEMKQMNEDFKIMMADIATAKTPTKTTPAPKAKGKK